MLNLPFEHQICAWVRQLTYYITTAKCSAEHIGSLGLSTVYDCSSCVQFTVCVCVYSLFASKSSRVQQSNSPQYHRSNSSPLSGGLRDKTAPALTACLPLVWFLLLSPCVWSKRESTTSSLVSHTHDCQPFHPPARTAVNTLHLLFLSGEIVPASATKQTDWDIRKHNKKKNSKRPVTVYL